jgi:integral membrane protein
MKKLLKISALLEGVSVLLLFGIAMPLKYWFGNESLIRPVGMGHGVLFIWYICMVLIVGLDEKWAIKKIAFASFLSLIPFGTFYADAKLFK